MTDHTQKLIRLLTSTNEDHWRLALHLIQQQGYNDALAQAMTSNGTKRALCLEYGFGWLILDRISENEKLATLLKANKGRTLPGWARGYAMLEELYRKKKTLVRNQQKSQEALNEIHFGGGDLASNEAEELGVVSEHIALIETRLVEVLLAKE
ncbi:hypothetical protein [Microscilla marina]|uniref:Uncharacterized protein n=1 Tax=Microscilla marina ATCC 23134 TaxID=313606 RepID=A1ZRZ9_MICM2|nr:hypothetical protein [Microscilla marina]EAY26887.1 hypothetical protein M23134_04837 [Microscilla marina ATCC 23134]